MARGVPPLVVAGVAAVLLVVVVAVDTTVTRSYELQVREDGAWRTIATSQQYDERDPFLRPSVTAAPNDTIAFRLVAHNEWPIGLDERYQVRHGGSLIDEGQLTAPARSDGSVEFDVAVDRVYDRSGPEPIRKGFGSVEVVVDGNYLWAEIIVEEGSS